MSTQSVVNPNKKEALSDSQIKTANNFDKSVSWTNIDYQSDENRSEVKDLKLMSKEHKLKN